ncbi:hypothetical protein [Sarcina ventriculi]|uniref:hypothetical protein n=1 Tax=Sarcina ventriculi TaxID=1267 RepID=UPI0018A91453|nr:hypothetical protein [Sarcina ventriculi]
MDKQLRQYKKQLNKLLKDQNIKVKSIFYLNGNIGYRAFLKYRDINLTKLNFLKPNVNKIFGCNKADFTLMDNGVLTLSIYKPQDFLDYKQVQLQDRELLLGYNQEGYIIANMGKYPHLLISGLSNQGKSKMVNYMLKNLEDRANILVLNGFKEDYRGFTLVQGTKAIQRRIEAILKDKEIRIKPLYLILEEMQSISKDKKLQEQLKELLSMGRHYNIFVIGIIQNATKENCSFKDLFNCRCSFRQIDSSSYQVCLGTSVEKGLEQREFYFLDSNLVKGYTFSI